MQEKPFSLWFGIKMLISLAIAWLLGRAMELIMRTRLAGAIALCFMQTYSFYYGVCEWMRRWVPKNKAG